MRASSVKENIWGYWILLGYQIFLRYGMRYFQPFKAPTQHFKKGKVLVLGVFFLPLI
jgi:hypothetical protein